MARQKQQYSIPSIVEDDIRLKAKLAYSQSKDKRLLTDVNGKICRQLEQYFPVPVELSIIEQVFAEEWFECAKKPFKEPLEGMSGM